MPEFPPNRLQEMAEAYLRGDQVDPRVYAIMLAVDTANIGRDFVKAAIAREEDENERLRGLLAGNNG